MSNIIVNISHTTQPITSNNNPFACVYDSSVSFLYSYNQSQMFKKANVLQYKSISSSTTKKQSYAQLCKGLGQNRKKSLTDCPEKTTSVICNSSKCSNVPGKEMFLCWDSNYKPSLTRLTYKKTDVAQNTNKNNKNVSITIKPYPPTLFIISETNDTVTIQMKHLVNSCLKINNYKIYQNNEFKQIFSSSVNTFAIKKIPEVSNNFYVSSISNDIESYPSNFITVVAKS